MKYAFATVVVFFSGWTACCAQVSNNVLSFELGKTGLLYNLNFDHKPASKNFGVRFGAGSNFGQYLTAITVGGGGYYLIGKQNRFFELGADVQYLTVDVVSDDQKGFTFVYPDYSIKTLYPSLNFGYRSYGKKTMFRIGVSPGIIKSELVPGGYVSYGIKL